MKVILDLVIEMRRALVWVVLMMAANAQAAEGTTERLAGSFGDWSKICSSEGGEEVCHISQSVDQNDSQGRLFQTSIGYLAGSSSPVVFLTAPLGMYLPRGITIELSESTLLSVAVQRCDVNGCLAVTTIDSAFLRELQNTIEGKIVFGSNAEQNIAIPLSLNGFAEGLASITPAEAAN